MAYNVCSICSHPQHPAINEALAKRVPLHAIAKQFGVHRSSLSRHNRKCLRRRREHGMKGGLRVPPSQCQIFVHCDETYPPHMRNQVPADLLNRDDVIILHIGFDPPLAQHVLDPRVMHPDLAFDEAHAENAQRDYDKQTRAYLESELLRLHQRDTPKPS